MKTGPAKTALASVSKLLYLQQKLFNTLLSTLPSVWNKNSTIVLVEFVLVETVLVGDPLYSSKGKIVYVVGKPCNIYRLRWKPYDNYRISPQSVNITGFPHNIRNLSLWGV